MTNPLADDWRLTNQENYLKEVKLTLKPYTKRSETWDHDHCEFCFKKFSETPMEDNAQQGYVTDDNYRWVCEICFNDFRDLFHWKT